MIGQGYAAHYGVFNSRQGRSFVRVVGTTSGGIIISVGFFFSAVYTLTPARSFIGGEEPMIMSEEIGDFT